MKKDNRVENLISMIKDNYCLSYDENQIKDLNEKTIRSVCKEYFEEIKELEDTIENYKEAMKNQYQETLKYKTQLSIREETIDQIKQLIK